MFCGASCVVGSGGGVSRAFEGAVAWVVVVLLPVGLRHVHVVGPL